MAPTLIRADRHIHNLPNLPAARTSSYPHSPSPTLQFLIPSVFSIIPFAHGDGDPPAARHARGITPAAPLLYFKYSSIPSLQAQECRSSDSHIQLFENLYQNVHRDSRFLH
ncbi:hypothetical protein NP233_g1409 [Leucocoprinus birnbaumii]|uniref:Uncharacterized protein n=1 Tax=Leucocoprinus birnbaumii TaxID=56174 RepID=A0AAD5W2K9_9AGAR|nr:hypothetical protein NP233_g1409 [Leucocoprinus birnbaumii]